MRLALVISTLVLSACNLKIKTDPPKDVAPKPAACVRGLVRDVPQGFQSLGQVAGSVRTSACDVLVVGKDVNGQIILAKFDEKGNLDDNYGERGVLHPFQVRYVNQNINIQRFAVINDGFFALGTYGRDKKALFVFRFLDSGFLDLSFGPLRDGVARGSLDSRLSLVQIGVPVLDADTIHLSSRWEDLDIGTEIQKEQAIFINGNQPFDKDLRAVPSSCEIMNYDSYKQQTTYQFSQSGCAELGFRSNGPWGSDSLTIAMNGTSYFSAVLGEMKWFYEGRNPVVISRDGLGFAKKEYVNFVQGQSVICGSSVDPRRRYMVFSTKTPQNADWLNQCWYL